jgi:TM2 domain-containing membrane protein YozV
VNPYEYPELTMMDGMTDQQRAVFLSQYNAVRKDEIVGVVLAVLLGHFGLHRFYLGEYGWGIVYLIFCWTLIPTLLGLIEAFFMPGRVRDFNLAQASILAMHVRQTTFHPGGLATV